MMTPAKLVVSVIGSITACYLTFAPRRDFYYETFWIPQSIMIAVGIFIVFSLSMERSNFVPILRAKPISTFFQNWPSVRYWGLLILFVILLAGTLTISFLLQKS